MSAVIPGALMHRGMPVPYINAWGDELDEMKWEIRWDPIVGGNAIFAVGERGRGEPDFTRQAPQRQRECMVLGLCQVCRSPVPAKRRTLVLSSMSLEEIDVDGLRGPQIAVTEPWICKRCLPIVLARCPGVRRRQSNDDLHVVEITRWTLTMSQLWHDRFGPEQTAVGWVKCVPTAPRLVRLTR